MAPTIPTTEPTTLYAGDTVLWTKTIGDYPASDGWTLTYSFRGPASLDDAVAAADGAGYAVTIAAGDTESLAAGLYRWTAKVSKAGQVFTVATGVFTVSATAQAVETTHAEAMVAAIKARLLGRAAADIESYGLAGRTAQKIPFEQLEASLAKWQQALWRERNPGRVGPKIAVTFGG